MSQKIYEETQSNYMDGVRVKISEKYKPPPRINLAITYNNRIQNVETLYDFSLELNVKDRIKELQNARKQLYEEKKERSEKLKVTSKQFENDKAKCEEALAISKSNELEIKRFETAETSNSNVLYPASYSHILMPTPLSNSNLSQSFSCKPNETSPFNISDFEADTSSPFDNMELKTINDIEELAQVLKKDKTINNSYNVPYTASQLYCNYVPLPSVSTHSNISSNFIRQETPNSNINYSSYIPPTSISYGQSVYSNLNGYYYNTDILQTNPKIKPENSNNSSQNLEDNKIKTFRSVPDIMKALENELDSTHTYSISQNSNLKKLENSDEKIFELLPKNLQQLSKSISLMGFPLPRVVRACQTLGNDHKKIVEHLLVMSELLDLGFSEKDVSDALLSCNNDRDKALDMLIP